MRLRKCCEMCSARLWFWRWLPVTYRNFIVGWGAVGRAKRYVVCSDFCGSLLVQHITLGAR